MNLNVIPLGCVIAFALAAIPFLLFVRRRYSLKLNWRLFLGLSVAMLTFGAILAAMALVARPSGKNTSGPRLFVEPLRPPRSASRASLSAGPAAKAVEAVRTYSAVLMLFLALENLETQ
jgi:hypothetical protein